MGMSPRAGTKRKQASGHPRLPLSAQIDLLSSGGEARGWMDRCVSLHVYAGAGLEGRRAGRGGGGEIQR